MESMITCFRATSDSAGKRLALLKRDRICRGLRAVALTQPREAEEDHWRSGHARRWCGRRMLSSKRGGTCQPIEFRQWGPCLSKTRWKTRSSTEADDEYRE